MFPEGRLFDFVIIGVVALIVVGPKDLPILMRKVGQVMARMRAMAAEFRASFDELARQSELDELRKEVEALRAGQTAQTVLGLTPEFTHELGAPEVIGDINRSLSGAGTDENLAQMIAASASANAEAERLASAPVPADEEEPRLPLPEPDGKPVLPGPAVRGEGTKA